jgi:hypothetical protein
MVKESKFLDFLTLKDGPLRCPKTSEKYYNSTLLIIPEEGRSHQHRGRGLKFRISLHDAQVWRKLCLNNPCMMQWTKFQ